jgi:ABC-type dipeptide/oligopeptide/nickel transport system permease component
MAWTLLLKRLLWALPTLFGVLVVVFVLLRVAPGDPIAMMIGPGATPDDIRALRALYGFDRSLPAQFLVYLGQAAGGHFGNSISLKQDVLALVFSRLPLTLELSALALALAVLMGGGAALMAVSYQGRFIFCFSVCCGRCCRCLACLTPTCASIPHRVLCCLRACCAAASMCSALRCIT